ncbi:MAG: hypothetical protein K0R75_309, partial [Paenibacillaceae bacterium]|nr:hypothetical protein [Paenibacillaceae bacterium]
AKGQRLERTTETRLRHVTMHDLGQVSVAKPYAPDADKNLTSSSGRIAFSCFSYRS